MKIHSSLLSLNRAIHNRKEDRVVFTNGIFDLLHPGHVQLLEYARAQGDLLIVGVNTDASVRRLKGPDRPLIPLAERMEILAAIRYVDHLISFGEDTPARLIEGLHRIQVLVKGGDYRPEDVVGRERVLREGGKVLLFPFRTDISTTRIIDRIRNSSG